MRITLGTGHVGGVGGAGFRPGAKGPRFVSGGCHGGGQAGLDLGMRTLCAGVWRLIDPGGGNACSGGGDHPLEGVDSVTLGHVQGQRQPARHTQRQDRGGGGGWLLAA